MQLLILILQIFEAGQADVLQATGTENNFEIFCPGIILGSQGSSSHPKNIVLKLIKNGECLVETIDDSITYNVKNNDLAYGEYRCVSVNTTVPSLTVLRTIILIPPSLIFSSDSSRGLFRVKSGSQFEITCGSSNQDTKSNGAIKLYNNDKRITLKQAKAPQRLSVNTVILPSITDTSRSYRCIRSGLSSDSNSNRFIYPAPTCTYSLTTKILFYYFVPYTQYFSRKYRLGDNIAFFDAPSDTIWKFGPREIFLPSSEVANVQLIDGVLYITNATILNTGTYTAVMPYEIFKINIYFNADLMASTPTQLSDEYNYDDDYDYGNSGGQVPSYDYNDNECPQIPDIPSQEPVKKCPFSKVTRNSYTNPRNGRYYNNLANDAGTSQFEKEKIFRAEVESKFTYTCEGQGDGVKNLYFEKNGFKIPSSAIQRVSYDKIQSVLEFSRVKFSDAGNYACVMEFFSQNSEYPVVKRLFFTLVVDPM